MASRAVVNPSIIRQGERLVAGGQNCRALLGGTSWQLKNKRPRGNGALNPVMVHLKYLVDDTDVSMLFERTSCRRDYPCFFSPGNYSTRTGGVWTRRGSNPHLHHDRETCSYLHHGPDFRVYGFGNGISKRNQFKTEPGTQNGTA